MRSGHPHLSRSSKNLACTSSILHPRVEQQSLRVDLDEHKRGLGRFKTKLGGKW